MLGKGIDATPDSNQQAVKEFLAPACAFEPQLSDEQDDRQDYAVRDKSTSHNKMCQTLPDMVPLLSAEPQSGDGAE